MTWWSKKFLSKTIEMGVVLTQSGRVFENFAPIIILEPSFKESCIRHCSVHNSIEIRCYQCHTDLCKVHVHVHVCTLVCNSLVAAFFWISVIWTCHTEEKSSRPSGYTVSRRSRWGIAQAKGYLKLIHTIHTLFEKEPFLLLLLIRDCGRQ